MSPDVFTRLLLLLHDPSRIRDERGDVPGWVMVTLMTAGLVTMIMAIAGDELQRMLQSALRSVSQ